MKKIIIIVGVILILSAGIWYFTSRQNLKAEGRYSFVEVKRGDLENFVSSTGTLSAVGTVEVGTQVSGIIDQVFADFNDNVKKGQILAVLDTTLLAVTIRDAQAGVLRSNALYEQAKYDYDQNVNLFEQNLISEFEFKSSETNKKSAFASLQSAKTALDRAKTNLNYAVIRSPIDGKVIFRNVERGQTVAASFATPTLFVIAEDLSKMEIHAQVDESDIGQIKENQLVRFTVQTYSDKTFSGWVRQIWLQPTTIQNVVNYTVVIDATNDENLLLPGMTATVDFLIEQRKDVLLVPNAALRLQPTPEMIAEVRENMRKRFNALPDSLKERRRRQMGNRGQFGGNQGMRPRFSRDTPKDVARIWYLDEDGKINVDRVRTGITDGKMTEITRSRDIYEGMKVISGLLKSSNGKESPERRPPGPGFGRRPF